MPPKPTKPRVTRRSKPEMAAKRVVVPPSVEVVEAEAVVAPAPRVRPVRDMTVVSARMGRFGHWGWLNAVLPRLNEATARAAVGEAGPGAAVPDSLVSPLRSRAAPLASAVAGDLSQAESLADVGDMAGALRMARSALRAAPDDALSLVRLARLLRRAGQDGPAAAALRAAVLSDQQGVLLGMWLGDGPAAEVAPVTAPEAEAVAVPESSPPARARRGKAAT